jgi:hypothetical protein
MLKRNEMKLLQLFTICENLKTLGEAEQIGNHAAARKFGVKIASKTEKEKDLFLQSSGH